ncbi:replication protein A 70 kDa DNA-binding subunit E-like [Helianthus annuus]|uniref:replication protein A 70 kDa DNA-binding subunit E-like n=1 Tax=Helianthus annuus TaxID=4232 RepID=UPI000B9092D5|nr:replication protein A 70 kDa DNA-binding subunit E-like [Helianthus annuus]
MARVDVSWKMTVQNLGGVDTVVTFRLEKHGRGFRYVANGWRSKFTKPNGINAPQRCTFVYSPDADKLILKKVSNRKMEVAKVTMLNDLNSYSNNYSIRVKIGNMIQASCLHKLLERFEEFLQLDECHQITKPSLAANRSSSKLVNRNEKTSLYFYTSVEKVLDWSGPKYKFNFVNLKDVVQNKVEVNTTVDFIGFVEVCFNIEDTTKKDGSKGKRLNLKIEDLEDQKCPVTLWDSFAVDMFTYMNDKKREKFVVIICHFGTVNLYKGKRGVANSFDLSRLFIDNADIEEIPSFRERYVAKVSASKSSNETLGSYLISNVEDEFLNKGDFMLIGLLGTILEKKKVLVIGTVTAICTDKLWYYNGCNHCKSRVEDRFVTKEGDDGSCDAAETKALVCTNNECQGVDIYAIPRFKIPIRVQDSSGTVSLTLFDYEALKIFKKSAKDLLAIQDQVVNSGEIPNPYPEVFGTLVGKKYAFVINVSDYNIEYQVENYGITMATNDDDIIDALYSKFNINQSESYGVPLSASVSNACEVTKDDVSITGDNVTPISNGPGTSKKVSSVEVKRNLGEVYELDDELRCSSTKRRMSDEIVEDEVVDHSKTLIPKIEK